MSDIDLIEYGEMRAAVQQLTRTVASLEVTVLNMNNIMQQASGGWKTIVTVGGCRRRYWLISHMGCNAH